MKGVECFASTYFHLPDNLVNRETQDDIAEVKLHIHTYTAHTSLHYMYMYMYITTMCSYNTCLLTRVHVNVVCICINNN